MRPDTHCSARQWDSCVEIVLDGNEYVFNEMLPAVCYAKELFHEARHPLFSKTVGGNCA